MADWGPNHYQLRCALTVVTFHIDLAILTWPGLRLGQTKRSIPASLSRARAVQLATGPAVCMLFICTFESLACNDLDCRIS